MLLLDVTRSTCLTNTELMRILDGSEPPHEAEQTEDHLDECPDCFSLLVSLVKALPGDNTKEDFGVGIDVTAQGFSGHADGFWKK